MIERWKATEKEVCKLLGKRHLGGPGQPDCSGGGEVVEVKAQRHRVNQWEMKEILEKPWAQGKPLIVASTSGFTPGAKEVAKLEGDVWLYKVYSGRGSRKITP
jgi:hypothetical protein